MEQDQFDSPPDRPELTPRMILTCPRCATRYFVDPKAVPASGRSVRCAACGDSWRAEPELDARDTPLDLDAASGGGAAAVAGPALPKAFRAKVEAKRRTRAAMTAGAAWAALGSALVLIVIAAVVLRREVVRLWPRAAGAYAALRLPVNPTGLSLEAVEGSPGLENGRAVMMVTGAERNVDDEARRSLPVRVSLFDHAGRTVATRIVPVPSDLVAPGDTRAFRAVFPEPPLATAEVGAEFAFAAPPQGSARLSARPSLRIRRIATPHGPPPPPPRLPATSPPIVDARPLPADSPYALAPHG